MLAQSTRTTNAETTRTYLPVWPLATVMLGITFALAAGAALPHLSGAAFAALWLLGLAAAAFVIALIGGKSRGELLWAYLVGGQIFSLIGVGLLLAA